jgi:ferric-dicitrate binding protein FerR (iron transport regulator)
VTAWVAGPVNQTIERSAGVCDNNDYCSLGHQANRGSTMTGLGDIKRDRRWLLRDGILLLPFILALRPARAVEQAGSVEDVTGEAFAERESVHRTLDRAAPVFLNEEVATGVASRLGMRLGRNTTVRLGEQARLKIDRFLVDAGGEMTLRSGPLLFDGKPQRAGLQIRSPFALIAVRGTRFFAGPSNDRFGVFVARGSVSVTAAGQQVVLREGEGTDVASPGAPPTPVKRWGAERVRAALASVS